MASYWRKPRVGKPFSLRYPITLPVGVLTRVAFFLCASDGVRGGWYGVTLAKQEAAIWHKYVEAAGSHSPRVSLSLSYCSGHDVLIAFLSLLSCLSTVACSSPRTKPQIVTQAGAKKAYTS